MGYVGSHMLVFLMRHLQVDCLSNGIGGPLWQNGSTHLQYVISAQASFLESLAWAAAYTL